jgi:hypothetical protein
MTLPTLSVLIPCYNGLPFVLDAVQSVLDQAEDGVECVVVDDGSRDGSADALHKRFGDGILLVRQPNGGSSVARNRALAESRGELVVWFDADDLLVADTLTERRAAFRDDPDLEMLVGQNEIFDMDTGEREISPQPPCDERYFESCLLARKNLPHLNILTFRRSALNRMEVFDPAFRLSQDYDLWIRAWALLRWRFVPRVFSHQRAGTFSSATRRGGRIKCYFGTGKVLLKNRRFLHSVFRSDLPWRRAYSNWAADLALHLLRADRRSEASLWALRALTAGGPQAEFRAVKYFLEGLLPPKLYQSFTGVYRRWAVPSAVEFVGTTR